MDVVDFFAGPLRLSGLSFRMPLLLAALLATMAQEPGLLRISVVVTDAAGNPTPIPRVQLLISDNPSTREPRRVRTAADGSVAITLPAGNYTVESDVPIVLGGRSLVWTQTLDVRGGRETALALTLDNADVDDSGAAPPAPAPTGPSHADAMAILNKWRRSIVQVWAPARHATGFVIDARGLIATNDRALGDATDVAVEFAGATAADRVKVPGRVIASARVQGVTLIWVDPSTIATRPPIAPRCGAEAAPPHHGDQVVAMIAPMLEPLNAVLGTVDRPTRQSFRVDWRLEDGTAGGPVFSAGGDAVGMTFAEEERDRERARERRSESYVIPLRNACSVIATATQKMAGASPPPAAALRTEADLPARRVMPIGTARTAVTQPPVIAASDFEIALMTPDTIGSDLGTRTPRTYFGDWTPYVANAPQVLFVRVTPKFEESFWKTLARGAAATQGVMLPALKSVNANFLRMRAFCGTAEVLPIQPLIVEMPLAGRHPIREGLYVFAHSDFGSHCATVRFDLYSEKSPGQPDSRTIDPAVFDAIGIR
jgi:hypothetical protein